MKKVLVTKSSMPDYIEYCEEIKGLWESHWLTNMGVKHEEFRKKLESYMEVAGIELFTNGHMALELAIQALGLKGEIITTPYTFASTTHAIVRSGCIPVFCDIKADDFTIDADKIEQLITEKTTAIMPVHVYGNICDVEKIDDIAKKYDLKVIYDAAHAFGVHYKGKNVACFGDISCFSFHATKVFNSIEGGAACFKEKEIGMELYRLKNFGIKNEEEVDGIGANAKMNEFCAAMGICNLRHFEEEVYKRKRITERYIEKLSKIKGIYLNSQSNSIKPNYSYLPILVNKNVYGLSRDEVYQKLINNGIGVRKYFYPITSKFDCYKGKYDSYKTPIAERISNEILTLPLYADLDLKIVDEICNLIKR